MEDDVEKKQGWTTGLTFVTFFIWIFFTGYMAFTNGCNGILDGGSDSSVIDNPSRR